MKIGFKKSNKSQFFNFILKNIDQFKLREITNIFIDENSGDIYFIYDEEEED